MISTNLREVAGILAGTADEPSTYTPATLSARLQAVMTPWMNEGFFADVVVLVEGEDDRAAVLGVAKAMGHDLEGNGFSIIPCGGKSNIDRPYTIFRQLNIPVYAVWDGMREVAQQQASAISVSVHSIKKPTRRKTVAYYTFLGPRKLIGRMASRTRTLASKWIWKPP